ncbi:hypothetical protein LY78DRAFT_480617 [Colletotrichum sublineola]|nr:hypothetical protein LY78DRAFT_480617 [Colletotrichum sublineola]
MHAKATGEARLVLAFESQRRRQIVPSSWGANNFLPAMQGCVCPSARTQQSRCRMRLSQDERKDLVSFKPEGHSQPENPILTGRRQRRLSSEAFGRLDGRRNQLCPISFCDPIERVVARHKTARLASTPARAQHPGLAVCRGKRKEKIRASSSNTAGSR